MRSSSRACSERRTDPPRVRPAVFRRRCIEVDNARGDSLRDSPRNDDFCRLDRARRARGARHETCLTCPCDLRAYAQPMRILRDRGGCAAGEAAPRGCSVPRRKQRGDEFGERERHARRRGIARPPGGCRPGGRLRHRGSEVRQQGKRRSIEIRTYAHRSGAISAGRRLTFRRQRAILTLAAVCQVHDGRLPMRVELA